MNAAKTQKNLEKMPHPSQKSKLLKRKGNSITPAKANAPISQLTIQTIQIYQMRNKKFKNKAWTTLRGNIKYIFASYSKTNLCQLF